MIFLGAIDKYWMEHLTAIEDLREGINLRGYAQIDPLIAYKNEAFTMFEKLVGEINYEVTRRLFKVEVEVKQQEKSEEPLVYKSASAVDPFNQQKNSSTKASLNEPTTSHQSLATNQHKLGRNDPCWCGSGKKYKKCHYPN